MRRYLLSCKFLHHSQSFLHVSWLVGPNTFLQGKGTAGMQRNNITMLLTSSNIWRVNEHFRVKFSFLFLEEFPVFPRVPSISFLRAPKSFLLAKRNFQPRVSCGSERRMHDLKFETAVRTSIALAISFSDLGCNSNTSSQSCNPRSAVNHCLIADGFWQRYFFTPSPILNLAIIINGILRS